MSIRNYLEKTSKKINKSSRNKALYQDRQNLDSFRKENLENLQKKDVKKMYMTAYKYKKINGEQDRKFFNKNVYNTK